jgi:hypothetical protein
MSSSNMRNHLLIAFLASFATATVILAVYFPNKKKSKNTKKTAACAKKQVLKEGAPGKCGLVRAPSKAVITDLVEGRVLKK